MIVNVVINIQQYPNYEILDGDEYEEECKENYKIYEVTVYENELLYLPGYYYHEVINNNFTIAMSIWFQSKNELISDKIVDYKLPINPNADIMTVADVDEFLYFIQILIEKWCKKIWEIYGQQGYPLKCLDFDDEKYPNGVYQFLLTKFIKIYPMLADLNYNTFEWYSISLDIENILKCTRSRIEDYGTILQFKEDLYFCFMFDDEEDDKYKKLWNKAADDIVDMHIYQYSEIGIADLQFVEYLEVILMAICDDANMLPIWIGFMQL